MAGYNNNQFNSYKNVQVETASPEMLILMMYDGALKFLRRSRIGFESMDFELINNNLIKTQAIIAELMACLDLEKGGEIAKNLLSLYVFINKNLANSNIEKDPQPLDICEELIQKLRDTWEEMMKKIGADGSRTPSTAKLNMAI